MTEQAVVEIPAESPMEHSSLCWKQPGHHGCAIKIIMAHDTTNLIAAFAKRGEMIAQLSKKCARLSIENAHLREKLEGKRLLPGRRV